MAEGVRLNKYLSEMGVCSRREADRLIAEGNVFVDGVRAVTGMSVTPGRTVVCRGLQAGAVAEPESRTASRPDPVLLAVNKPRGVVCTASAKDRAPNIVEMVHYPSRVYPVGRLDKDSEGLILMTNQGDLVNRILRGRNGHEKEYLVTVDRPVTKTFIERMQSGVWLKELETRTEPCRCEITGKREFRIILTQGLNRQIRRMCGTLGWRVRELKRVRIMNIRLGNLKTGAFRKVTPEEYRELLELLDAGRSRYGNEST